MPRRPPAAAPDPLRLVRHVAHLLEQEDERRRPVPPASPPHPHRPLTVGMSTFDDVDGVYFTIEAVRLYHPEVTDEVSFLVVDNHPRGPEAAALRSLEDIFPNFRYVPFAGYESTAVRDLVFREASSDSVLCVDSHVMVRSGGLRALIDHFERDPASRDLVQGPILNRGGGTHMDPVWRAGMFGTWARDERLLDPTAGVTEIGMHGLGLFACRRDAWPGLNPRFRGFGGEEGYLHEKIRRMGGRVLCAPSLGWSHRFTRARPPAYGPSWGDRIRNYFIGWRELGLDTAPIAHHFREFLGPDVADPLIAAAEVEVDNPFSAFDAIFCLNLDAQPERWEELEPRLEQLGVRRWVERFPAVPTPENHHEGCARSFRAMVAEAKRRALRCILVVEDDAIFLDDTTSILTKALAELAGREWDLLYLGGVHRRPPVPVDGATSLERPTLIKCAHALAFNHTAYDRILSEVPADDESFDGWLARYRAIDDYLPRRTADGAFRVYVTRPRIASQPALLNYDDADRALAERYTIR